MSEINTFVFARISPKKEHFEQAKDALENHHQEEHTQLVAQKFEHWLAAPTEVTLMKKL